ncbi:MAG: pyridoxal-phosphate dependent enzyme [Crocinitomicaceae bacterium]|nr:pyridoxal-phosphate dependent enzyme [Crocinitomicaceae bacterium]
MMKYPGINGENSNSTLKKFHQGKYDSVLTFGGAYSNHIAATAALTRLSGIPTIGIIRGDELNELSNHTLKKANDDGMKLVFVSREEYNQRYERMYHEELRNKFGNALLIPEGGANHLGVYGVSEIISELPFSPDYIYTASGTGTTAAGLLTGSSESKIHAVSSLKADNYLKNEIQNLLYYAVLDESEVERLMKRLSVIEDCHFGGYGKYTQELIDFINGFHKQHTIKLDQVYTGKMAYAFYQDLKSNKFKQGEKVVLLHTGGLQGITFE